MSAATDRFVAAVLREPDIPRELIAKIEADEYMIARELHVAVHWRCHVKNGDAELIRRVDLALDKHAPAWAKIVATHLAEGSP